MVITMIIIFLAIQPMQQPSKEIGVGQTSGAATQLRRPTNGANAAMIHAILTDKAVEPPELAERQDKIRTVPAVSSGGTKETLGANADDAAWLSKLQSKSRCVAAKKGAYYLYHFRKTGGTTLREMLNRQARRTSTPFFETEGLTMPPGVLQVNGMVTVTSLRCPIERILSLYWYEHVAWFVEVKGNVERHIHPPHQSTALLTTDHHTLYSLFSFKSLFILFVVASPLYEQAHPLKPSPSHNG